MVMVRVHRINGVVKMDSVVQQQHFVLLQRDVNLNTVSVIMEDMVMTMVNVQAINAVVKKDIVEQLQVSVILIIYSLKIYIYLFLF